MGNGIVGKILFFWVFLIGAMFIASRFGMFTEGYGAIGFCVAVGLIYVVWIVFRELGKRKREEKAWTEAKSNPQPVHKGQGKRKKK